MKKIATIILLALSTICFSQTPNFFLEGVAEIKKGHFENAKLLLTSALKNKPENSKQILFYRGIAFYNNQIPDSAITDLKKSLELGNSEAALWLAKAFAEKVQEKSSVQYIQTYLSSFPEMNYNSIIKDPAFHKIQMTQIWQSFVSGLQQTETSEVFASFNYFFEKEDFQQAQNILDKALVKEPLSASLHAFKALCYSSQQNYPLALYEIKQSISINSKQSEYYSQCADYQMLLNQYSNAASSFEEALKLKPEDFQLYIKSAKAYFLSKDTKSATQKITTYLHYFESDSAAVFLSAKINYETTDYINALKQLNSLFAKYTPKSDWYLLRGLINFQLANFKYAASDLSMCLDITPNNPDANLFLGQSHFQLGNNQLACYYWQRAENSGDVRSFELLQKYCGK